MLFNSLAFLIFFPTVVALYFCLPHRFRVFFLLAASCVFYMWLIPWYIVVLLFLIVVDYTAAIIMEKYSGQAEKKSRRRVLVASILSTCLVLFVFKYDVLLNEMANAALSLFSINFSTPTWDWALPIGLSFHTFQSLSYVIEVYKGNQKAERNFWIYALYVMFFPQLVAGPIERPQHMIPQFHKVHYFSYADIVDGGRLILWGLFKKVVVADRIALLVNYVFGRFQILAGAPIMLGIGLFAIQIYLDFSAYSDIARGTAKCMGFDLSLNFNRPYFATSVAEFWRRWHISLTSWFKDYVYIPLGGNKVSALRNRINLMITFALSGVWHGAHIHFIIWGVINGLYVTLEKIASVAGISSKASVGEVSMGAIKQHVTAARSRIQALSFLKTPLKRMGVFASASVAFTFFRADTAGDALTMLEKGIAGLWGAVTRSNAAGMGASPWFGSQEFQISYILFFTCVVWLVEYFFERPDLAWHRKLSMWFSSKTWLRWSMYYALIFSIAFLGAFTHTTFIYFQF